MGRLAEGRLHMSKWVLAAMALQTATIFMEIPSGTTSSIICSFGLNGVVCNKSTGSDTPMNQCFLDRCVNGTTSKLCVYDNVTYACVCHFDTNRTVCSDKNDSTAMPPTTVPSSTAVDIVTEIAHVDPTYKPTAHIIIPVVFVLVLVLGGATVGIYCHLRRRGRRGSKVLIPPPHKDAVRTDLQVQNEADPVENEANPADSEADGYQSLAAADPQGPASYSQLLKRQGTEDSYTEVGDLSTGAAGVNDYDYVTGKESDYYNISLDTSVAKKPAQPVKTKAVRRETADDAIYQNV